MLRDAYMEAIGACLNCSLLYNKFLGTHEGVSVDVHNIPLVVPT